MNSNIIWHHFEVNQAVRAVKKNQSPILIWFTGLSGAGKSTLAGALEQILTHQGYHTYLLDGDNLRHGLCSDLGFSDEQRKENIRRVGEVAKLMMDAGLIVLATFISPFKEDRDIVRNLVPAGNFIEVFVSADIEKCIERDPKGLYKLALSGKIPNFTGIDSRYEEPDSPDLTINTDVLSEAQSVNKLIEYFR